MRVIVCVIMRVTYARVMCMSYGQVLLQRLFCNCRRDLWALCQFLCEVSDVRSHVCVEDSSMTSSSGACTALSVHVCVGFCHLCLLVAPCCVLFGAGVHCCDLLHILDERCSGVLMSNGPLLGDLCLEYLVLPVDRCQWVT